VALKIQKFTYPLASPRFVVAKTPQAKHLSLSTFIPKNVVRQENFAVIRAFVLTWVLLKDGFDARVAKPATMRGKANTGNLSN